MSEKEKHLEKIGLLSIHALNTHTCLKSFYVGSYQRGYRWGVTEVEYLLNDINGVAEGKKYCIQPLTVRDREDSSWELIDGQQRSTTIYLIQAVLKNCFAFDDLSFYALEYDTRSATKDFLIAIKDDDILKPYLGVDIEERWKDFTAEYSSKDNVDNYFLFHAYLTINNWLYKLEDCERDQFCNKLLNQTYIIWHPVTIEENSAQTVEDFFINMNAGKIKLTSAELIKALFITAIEKGDDPWNIKDFKKRKLANEWDYIENELNNDTFWYFINNNKHDYPTRIGKLFDIDCKKPTNEDDLYAYIEYSKKESLDWEKIKQIFNRLKEWYEDVVTYHLIGFIINAGFKSLEEIITDTSDKSKTVINSYLHGIIKDEFNKTIDKDKRKVYEIDNLNYETNNVACKNVLLLYNIFLIERNFPGQRFPFDLYQDPKTKWSIEHIHPQNPKGIKLKADASEWLSDFEKRLEDEGKEGKGNFSDKIKEIKEKLEKQEGEDISNDLSSELKEFSSAVGGTLDLHQIGNLALLDKRTNSKIGNKSFLKKRALIINESDRDDNYIPLGTIHNFLKKTTNTAADNNIQFSFWSAKDAEDYTRDIEKLLVNYLPKKED